MPSLSLSCSLFHASMLGIAKQPITAANVADARKALAYLEYTMKRCQEGRFESRHGVASELISHTVSTLRSKIASIPAAAEAPAAYATASEREESSAPSPAAQPHLQHEPLPPTSVACGAKIVIAPGR